MEKYEIESFDIRELCSRQPDRRMYEFNKMNGERIANAMKVLSEEIGEDDSYALGWQANIAMSMVDSGVDHKTANEGAGRFMKLCFGRDTSDLV